MINNKKNEKNIQKEARERYHDLTDEEKKDEKRSKKDIKILLKKKKKSVSVFVNVIKIVLRKKCSS